MSYEPDVADIAELRTIIPAGLPDKPRIRVLTLLQEFWYDSESNDPPDNITVVMPRHVPKPKVPAGGVSKRPWGRWIRNPLPVPEWTSKRDWFQDSLAGNDEYSGDAGSPVKTMAEITRRLRRVDSTVYTINQLGAVPSTDSVRFAPDVSDKGAAFLSDWQTVARILIRGKRGKGATGTFTAATPTDPKTNTQATVTAVVTVPPGLPASPVKWSDHIGQILQSTSATTGSIVQTVVLKDLGTGKARVSEWAKVIVNATTGIFGISGELSAAIPVAGDTYEIVELPEFSAPILYAGLPSRVELGFQDITVAAATPGVIPSDCVTSFTSCKFTVAMPGPPAGFPFWCFLRACSVVFDKATDFCRTAVGEAPRFTACGLVNARIQASSFGRTTITNTVIQGGAIRGIETKPGASIFGGLIVLGGKVGIFDSPPGESAVTLQRGMAMQIVKDASVYGSNAAVRVPLKPVFGVEVIGGASLAVQADVTPAITSVDGDVRVEGVGTAIPALVAGKPVPDAEPLSTWTEWRGPEFSGNVFNYMTGSRIITTP